MVRPGVRSPLGSSAQPANSRTTRPTIAQLPIAKGRSGLIDRIAARPVAGLVEPVAALALDQKAQARPARVAA